ncbi:MAG: hypothetical protein NT148_00240 [Candidatus Nealsonbacteria bacterium]|nr:hypothetical protein [Candidatus Nealsonbacteria bacterium]
MEQAINGAISFLFHPEFTGIFLFIKIIFIIISAALAINIFFLIAHSSWFAWRYKMDLHEFKEFKPLEAGEMSVKWKKVEDRMKTKSEAEYKLAVLEAEDLLKQALKMDGYEGDTLEVQLGKVDSSDISDTSKVLKAHNFRNKIVKDEEIKVSFNEARAAVDDYKKAFEEMQEY